MKILAARDALMEKYFGIEGEDEIEYSESSNSEDEIEENEEDEELSDNLEIEDLNNNFATKP